VPYSPSRFEIIKEPCVVEGRCWLKNMYFRGDAEFYAELDEALQKTRKKEIRWITGTKKQRKRAADLFFETHPRAKSVWDWGRDSSRPFRKFLKSRFGWDLTDAV
jgi:hypothetical protein